MITIKPPQTLTNDLLKNFTVFLAGSIEMGLAKEWQKVVENRLLNYDGFILNPRRDDWDSSWEQKIENDQFRQQVNWELTGLDNSDLIAMYFSEDTISPISLLELGLHARKSNMIVCCPDGFKRKGNVEIVCNKYNVPLTDDFEKFIGIIKLHAEKYKL